MVTAITIRDVPDETRDELAARAALSGRSLQEYLRSQLYEPFATRVWELRENITAYDGWCVALAESLGARLATPDLRPARTIGPRCAFTTP
ncbi:MULTISPECIES: FitA-like ribbon-helix-helix domain-containing protein [Protofrankia]|uniref:Antitoxin FitA-like ribbon-helix-helix domain-containing protein n=1 Tax=Protofrankia coriariae TaxID=1562887 RepID=A0ABR5F8J2_9ACTN|nr:MULTISPECIES: hypothetical protein [Protofrankia]KLL13045.1 hypothetical protein FrCorBMG51_00465 [Protofrankia coriariae]ONH38022.1 hypothetical protein BL254_00840 [Protofrankia sp. BMG5.30]